MRKKENMEEKTELKGIGGWLILVAIGITFSPFFYAAMDYYSYSLVFGSSTWNELTYMNSPSYTPYYSLWVYIEVVIAVIIDAYLFYLMYIFYKKKSDFPSLYIKLVFIIFALNLVSIWMANLIFPAGEIELFSPTTIKAISQSIFAILVWVPYMNKSVRVKNTFIN